jgi:hypothetical protein
VTKRYSAFLVTLVALTVGVFLAPDGKYGVYAGVLGTMFSVYATGQSYTDAKGK